MKELFQMVVFFALTCLSGMACLYEERMAKHWEGYDDCDEGKKPTTVTGLC